MEIAGQHASELAQQSTTLNLPGTLQSKVERRLLSAMKVLRQPWPTAGLAYSATVGHALLRMKQSKSRQFQGGIDQQNFRVSEHSMNNLSTRVLNKSMGPDLEVP